MNNAMID